MATSLAGLRPPSGSAHEDRRRLVEEVERAGDDVAVRIDHQPRRRAGAKQHALDLLQAADGLDLHDRRGDAIDGGLERGLLLIVASSRADTAAACRTTQRASPTGDAAASRRRLGEDAEATARYQSWLSLLRRILIAAPTAA